MIRREERIGKESEIVKTSVNNYIMRRDERVKIQPSENIQGKQTTGGFRRET